ncbi:MAG: uroporphyrinogen decarboxylase family protein [Candidatus Hydrothermarchaeaceae archaeon]
MNSKQRVMGLLTDKKVDRIPCFSGMGNVTKTGLQELGYGFSETHTSATKMARFSASTYKLFNFESTVVPFDVGLEAEAMGCEMNFYEGREGIIYPTVRSKIIDLSTDLEKAVPPGIERRGRVPMVVETIEIIKDDVGGEVAVGAYVLGPFTLAGQVMELNELLMASFKEPAKVQAVLNKLADVIIFIAGEFEKAGVDFLTIREMGASSDVISPRMFKNLVMPPLVRTIENISPPGILHICGNTDPIIEMMNECGADALSVEQRSDVKGIREKLGSDPIILGNIDPFNVLVKGTPDDVRDAVKRAIDDGVNGVMPGCDIWPEVPPENMKAMVEATAEFGGL